MAGDFLSDHYAEPLAFIETGSPRPGYKVPQEINGAYVHYRRAYANIAAVGGGDVVRMMQVRSSDRIHDVLLSASVGSVLYDIGIWHVGGRHNGPAVGALLFADGISFGDRQEAFTQNSLVDEERGRPLWELLGLTSDPQLDYDLVLQRSFGTGQSTTMLEMFYTRVVS